MVQTMAELNDDRQLDPFSPENVGAFQLIATMRLYDVMMALYREQAPGKAERLEQLHEEGKVLGSFPWLNMSDTEV